MTDFRLSQMFNGLRGPKFVTKTGGGTLTPKDSGAVCLFDVTTVLTYTLPPAEAGLRFRFVCQSTAAGSSDIFRVVCATGDFFRGTIWQGSDGTYIPVARAANGSTHLAWQGNGSTTGGIAGDWFEVQAISDTVWQVTAGYNAATGTEATPWQTS